MHRLYQIGQRKSKQKSLVTVKSRVVTAGSLNFPEATKIDYGMLQELTIVENDVLGARQREARKEREVRKMANVAGRKDCDLFTKHLITGDGKNVEVNISLEDVQQQAADNAEKFQMRLGAYAKKMCGVR